MNLHLLRTFAAVAVHRSFSRAAEAIHVSQPAVSRAVRELEEQLDIALVARAGGRVRLTEAGAALYEHARAIFALERAALADLRGRRGLEQGSLVIGAGRTIGTYFLPPLIARFMHQHPGIEVRIISENTQLIQRRLLGYELDVAFIEGPVEDPRVEQRFWREDELVILASAHHPLLNREKVTAADMDGERWVVREEGSGTRVVTLSLLQQAGIDLKRMLEVGGNGAVVQSVAAGLGLAMISAVAAHEHLSIGKVKVVNFPIHFSRPLYTVRLRDKPLSPAARALTALAQEIAEHAPSADPALEAE
jgi:DNA-binding transcriptional LysR family regulator